MKVLFVCGAAIVDGEIHTASWIKSIITFIDPRFEIIIASTDVPFSQQSVAVKVNEKEICLYPIAGCSADELTHSINSISADVIVIFGTESDYTLPVLKACQNLGLLGKTTLFAQGLCSVCAQHYAEGVPDKVVRRYTFRDILRRQNIAKERQLLSIRSKAEKEALELTQNLIGRTTMDHAILRQHNATAAYYKCNDVLRSSFYHGQWTYDVCEKHRIFISQYYYPLKGFHYLLEAVAQLKSKYPDIKIAAAGYNPIQKPLPQKELKDSSYIRYVKSLIKQFELSEHIVLLGELSEEQMKEEYLKANAFVMPSTIENSPNSLAEAMMLGVPTIASDVGGVTDFANHKEESYIYPSSATYLLAHYIDKVFSARKDAEVLGMNGKRRAEKEYNREVNIKRLEETLKTIAETG